MYKFILVLFVSFVSAQQTCKLSFSNNSLSENGEIVFVIKNIEGKKIKVPKQYSAIWARPTDIQVYNDESKQYLDTKYSFDGASCLNIEKCLGKMTCLKSAESKEYRIPIVPGRISKAFKEKKKYRFKLAFDTYLFSGCSDYKTDWLYYQN
ncbi:hypothetical protein [Chryseobacterium paludis]|uniref:hypothetical protein n=1 Tax=Chryseobacterium paludis TaxID=2956784 RepID=UPI0021C109BA|nr:hypothetical protein [Chryseobacterium paludis]